MRAKATQDIWARRVAAWRQSGKSAEAFAEEHGLSDATLRWWSTRLRKVAVVPAKPEARLARVVVKEEAPQRGLPLVLEFARGLRIVVSGDTDRDALALVLDVLVGGEKAR